MNHSIRFHWWQQVLLWLLLVCGTVAQAAAAKPSLEGFWKGPLKVPGGQLEVIFRLVSLSNGTYFATLDVPLQKVSRMPVAVTVQGDTVTFVAEEAGSRFTGQVAPDGKVVAGTWKQPGYEVPMTLSYAAPTVSTAPKARLTPPYREEEVVFSNLAADLRFAGMLTVPAGEGPFPAVVLLAGEQAPDRDGTMGDYRLLGALGDYLTRRGVAVLRYDGRGIGQSTGQPGKAGIPGAISDVQAALNYLRTRPEIDLAHLGVIGHGEGGNVALLTATQPLPPSFVVTLSAYGLTGTSLVQQQQAALLRAQTTDPALIEAGIKRQQAMLDIIRQTPDAAQAQAIVANMLRQNNPALTPQAVQDSAALLTSPSYRTFLGFDPLEKLADVKCPVLLLNGTADTDVAADANLAALAKSLKGNKDVAVRKLIGVNHLFQPSRTEWPLVNGQQKAVFSPAAQESIREWIVQQTKSKK